MMMLIVFFDNGQLVGFSGSSGPSKSTTPRFAVSLAGPCSAAEEFSTSVPSEAKGEPGRLPEACGDFSASSMAMVWC